MTTETETRLRHALADAADAAGDGLAGDPWHRVAAGVRRRRRSRIAVGAAAAAALTATAVVATTTSPAGDAALTVPASDGEESSVVPLDPGEPVVMHPDERYGKVVQCVEEHGFDATEQWRGILLANVPDEQGPRLNAVVEACEAKYVMPPEIDEPPTAGQLSYLYDYYAGTLTPCLQALGNPVPPPPDREVFTAAGQEYQAVWDPYANVVGEPYQQCPPAPPWDGWLAAR